MTGTLRYTENNEWVVYYEKEGDFTRNLSIHYEQLNDMEAFNVDEEYVVEFSLCFIVQIQKYCARIAKSSFPEKIQNSVMEMPKITKFEVLDEKTGTILYKANVTGVSLFFEDNGKSLRTKLK